jgi:hypothetical protein
MSRNAPLRSVIRAAAVMLLLAASGAMSSLYAAEKLRVGKAVPGVLVRAPRYRHAQGLLRQERARDRVDRLAATPACSRRWRRTASISAGSGPAWRSSSRLADQAVAAMAGPPLLLAIVVRPDGPSSAADLKGKKISVSTAGSLTYWLVSETSRRQGWGPKGIDIAPMGAMPGQIAAMKRGGIDGAIMVIGNAFELEKRGEAASSFASPTSRISTST